MRIEVPEWAYFVEGIAAIIGVIGGAVVGIFRIGRWAERVRLGCFLHKV